MLVSVTTAKTRLVVKVLITYYGTSLPLCYEESLSQSWGRSVVSLFFYSLSKSILLAQNI